MNSAINELAQQDPNLDTPVAPVEPQKETVVVKIVGIRDEDQPIEQEMDLIQQQGTPVANSIMYAWSRVHAIGGIVFDNADGRGIIVYPEASFKKITVDVSPATGTTL